MSYQNHFDELRSEILKDYPDAKTLPFWTWLKLRMFSHKIQNFREREVPNPRVPIPDTYGQRFQTVQHAGKEYFVKFGWDN